MLPLSCTLPDDVQIPVILHHLPRNPFKVIFSELKKCYADIVDCLLIRQGITRQINPICQARLKELKDIYKFSVKYSQYNEEYEHPTYGYVFRDEERMQRLDLSGNPHLYDALLTGCRLPLAKRSLLAYDQAIEADIKRIVELTPQSLNCTLGRLRCIDQVPPLFAACLNVNIPLHIVKYLLEKGANPHANILIAERCCTLIDALKKNEATVNESDPNRFAQIAALFEKYGAN